MRPDSSIQWRAYPALGLAGCLGLGIVLAARFPQVSAGAWAAVGLGGLAVAGIGAFRVRRRLVTPARLGWTLAALVMAVAAGAGRYAAREVLPPDHIAHHALPAGRPVLLEGTVRAATPRPGALRLTVAAHRLVEGEAPVDVRGLVQATLYAPRGGARAAGPAPGYGDRLVLRGTLRAPPPRRNPADFDYGAFLRRRGLRATLSAPDTAFTVVGRACQGLGCGVAAAQAYVRAVLDRHVPSEAARAVLAALVLGDRAGIDDDTRGRFARTGLMHLLAVSGLHVLLVGMVLYNLLRPFLLRLGLGWRAMEAGRSALTLLVLLAYLLLTGAAAPVVRAVVMAALLMLGVLLQRTSPGLNTLGVAALVLLVARPTHLFEAGFQLSFAAVGAIMVFNPILTRPLPDRWQRGVRGYVAGLVTVSTAATLGTMPVLLYHFGAVPFGGLVLNVVAIPVTFLTLAAGLALVVTGAAAFGAAADVLATLLLATAGAGDAVLARLALPVRVESGWYLAALAAALVVPVQWPRPRHRWRLVAFVLACATAGLWHGHLTRRPPGVEVVFFDVGQGDAALATLPSGRRLLIDAGPRDDYVDQGARTLLPHLARYGIDRLDAVVISHPHSDHLGGLPAVLRSVRVGRVLHNGRPYDSDLYREVLGLLDSLGVPHQALLAGDTLSLDPAVRLYVLAPAAAEGGDVNDASVVLRLAYGGTSFLFTGDAEAAAEAALVARYAPFLRADVVKVAHHGSATSSGPAFVARAAAGLSPLAVVSVARVNRFGHPSVDVVARWQAHGAAVHLTSDGAARWLYSDGRTLRTIPF